MLCAASLALLRGACEGGSAGKSRPARTVTQQKNAQVTNPCGQSELGFVRNAGCCTYGMAVCNTPGTSFLCILLHAQRLVFVLLQLA